MKTFYQSIGDGVVGSRADALGTKEMHELCPEFGLELTSSVCGDGGWGTKAGNPTGDEGSGDGLSCDVRDRDGFRPTGEAVNAGEQVCVSSGGREWSNKVDVDVVKANVRAGKGGERCDSMSMHLGALTL